MPRSASRCVKGATWKLSEAQRQHLLSRYLLPQPRNALAEAVRTHASAAMDVSDGLAGDFAKLCRVSQVAAEIDVARVPLSDAAKAALAAEPAMLETALTGGDDYEIVCTVPAAKAESFRAAAQAAKVAVSEIGAIKAGEGVRFLGSGGQAAHLQARLLQPFLKSANLKSTNLKSTRRRKITSYNERQRPSERPTMNDGAGTNPDEPNAFRDKPEFRDAA